MRRRFNNKLLCTVLVTFMVLLIKMTCSAQQNELDDLKYITEGISINNESTEETIKEAVEKQIDEIIEDAFEEEDYYVVTMKVTAYCHCATCCGVSGNATASGTMPTAWQTVASGPSYEFGTQIYIPQLENQSNGGWFVVEDRGVNDSTIDIYMDSHQEALNFGVQYYDVYIYG